MGLDMMQPPACRLCKCPQGAGLIEHHLVGLLGRNGDVAPSKAHQVGKPRVCANRDLVTHGKRDRLRNGAWVPRMKATGDICAREVGHEPGIVSHGPCTKAFAQVGVQINRSGHCRLLS